MKTLKTSIAALAAIACVSVAQAATTVVRITGSTAFRGNTHTAITHIFDSGFTYGYTGATLSGATQAIFNGTVGGAPGCSIRQVTRATIESEQPISFHVDGEPATGGTSLLLRIHPGALYVSVKAG